MKPSAWVIIVLLAVTMPVRATYYAPVTWYPADSTNWCWAGCTQMILEFYGYDVTEQRIGQLGTGGVDSGNVLCGYQRPY